MVPLHAASDVAEATRLEQSNHLGLRSRRTASAAPAASGCSTGAGTAEVVAGTAAVVVADGAGTAGSFGIEVAVGQADSAGSSAWFGVVHTLAADSETAVLD